ncbi:hypothetical protein CEP52_006024 [Fusarium oligoseptatum]|uniref:Uncharacterized protein n=1 Tax=Fusarium oligoseptatum TaxID=2604345 RepID=A0A428TV22_9HYPO|nr:hypothetical protein CEP52_006024 [Fusarium oligoseptatum]
MDAQLASGSRCCEARLANPAPMARISHRQPRVRGMVLAEERDSIHERQGTACPSTVKLPVILRNLLDAPTRKLCYLVPQATVTNDPITRATKG